MKRVEKLKDGRLFYYTGKYKMAYIVDVNKDLELGVAEAVLITVTDPYIKYEGASYDVWANIKDKVDDKQLEQWEKAIYPLEMARLEEAEL